MFKIGNIEIKNKVVLAPMAGISNAAYIKICEEMNVGYAVTELISSEAIVRNNKKTFDMLNGIEKLNIPIAIQIFGSNPDVMAKSAKIISDLYKNVIIDINMGCPVPKVAMRAEAGSGLLKNPSKVREIVTEVVKAVSVPVTVKIRSGWDFNSINAVEIAKIIEESGASAITVHPRTRSQGYSGLSDWNIIKQVKENVSIPVIGNGDIKSKYDALKMIETTNCDAVMIGRAALGNPWLLKETVRYLNGEEEEVDKDIVLMIKKHLDYLLMFKEEKTAILEMRTHIGYYLKNVFNASKFKPLFMKISTKEEFYKLLDEIKNEISV